MSKPFQTINIQYSTKSLNLVDFYTLEPLYKIKVDRHVPQMEMRRLQPGPSAGENEHKVCAATFKLTSLNVHLSIHEHDDILFSRDQIFSTKYTFVSPFLNAPLTWKADGALSGNYILSNEEGGVFARFRNKLFSNTEVGTLEIVDEIELNFKDEIVISGLAMLVMVQSLNLGVMVMV